MYYWTRAFVNERLKLAKFQSYRIIPATPSGRISSDYVVQLLNRTGVGATFRFCVPSDILTQEELVARYAESGITPADIRRWTKRRRNPLPHYRLSKYALRFSAEEVENWLREKSLA